MMRIYFDDDLILDTYYAGITKTSTVVDKELLLGTTICDTYKLTIGNDGFTNIPSIIRILNEGKNIVPTDFSYWESGHYAMDDGSKQDYNTRIRVADLVEVIPSSTYYVNLSGTPNFVIRTYDKDKKFVRSLGGLQKGQTFTLKSTERYLGIALYEITYDNAKTNWDTMKPIICLSSYTDKSYEEWEHNNKKFYVDSYSNSDFVTTFNLSDKMVDFNFNYDASGIVGEKGTELINIFNNIIGKSGIKTDITEFSSSDKVIGTYDSTRTARDYLRYIGELNGWFFYIGDEDKLCYKEITAEPVKTFTFDEISTYHYGVDHSIQRVCYDNGSMKFVYPEGTENDSDLITYYIDTNNMFFNTQEQTTILGEKIVGNVSLIDFDTDNMIYTGLESGDIIEFTNGDNSYRAIVQFNETNFSADEWFGSFKFEMESNTQQETAVVGSNEIIKNITTKINYIDGTLESVATKSYVNANGQAVKDWANQQFGPDGESITAIKRILNEDGVSLVKTATTKIDADGITVSSEGSKITTNINNKQFSIQDSGGNTLAKFGYNEEINATEAVMDNLTIEKYFVVGNHRLEKYKSNRTGMFYIGD